jgi:hypothetical protein
MINISARSGNAQYARNHSVLIEPVMRTPRLDQRFPRYRKVRSTPGMGIYAEEAEARLVLQVHDELLLEVQEQHAQEVSNSQQLAALAGRVTTSRRYVLWCASAWNRRCFCVFLCV